MRAKWREPIQTDRLWPLWYGLAFLANCFGSGRWAVALAAWLAMVFMLRFVRTQRPLRGFLLGVPATALSFYVGWYGLVPWGGGAEFIVIALSVGVVGMLLMLFDRLLYPRLEGLAATLVFPCLIVSAEFLSSLASDAMGSFAVSGYSQFGNSALVQLASVTGIWGISFLLAWSASVFNLLWERGFDFRRALMPVGSCLAVLALVILGGGARLATSAPNGPPVRVAMIADAGPSGADLWPTSDFPGRYFAGRELSDAEWDALGERSRARQGRLLERSMREAGAGAKMVFWAEANGAVREEDEPSLIARGAALARSRQIYIGMSLFVLPRDIRRKLQNKIVLLGPDGKLLTEYHKAVPVPGFEKQHLRPGSGRIGIVDTAYGRIGLAICYDLDFPRMIAQAGPAGVDILIGPSNDWPAISRVHREIASFRAIEQGFSLVRPVGGGGASSAVDPYGRVLSYMDATPGRTGSTTALVSTRGVTTTYSRIGDVVGWGAILGFCLLLVAALRRRRRTPADAQLGARAMA